MLRQVDYANNVQALCADSGEREPACRPTQQSDATHLSQPADTLPNRYPERRLPIRDVDTTVHAKVGLRAGNMNLAKCVLRCTVCMYYVRSPSD